MEGGTTPSTPARPALLWLPRGAPMARQDYTAHPCPRHQPRSGLGILCDLCGGRDVAVRDAAGRFVDPSLVRFELVSAGVPRRRVLSRSFHVTEHAEADEAPRRSCRTDRAAA